MSADFLDSNIFVYAFDQRDERKRLAAESLIADATHSGTGVISYQVVQETLNAVTTRISPALPGAQASALLSDVLAPLWKVMPDAVLYERGLQLSDRYQFHFYDALIVAAALEAGCSRLLSEDLQHGQRIEGLVIENPFR